MSATVQFKPVKTGNMTKIPADLAPGIYMAQCSVKKAATAKDQYPMLICEWKTYEAVDADASQVGNKVADFIVFFPAGAPGQRMSLMRLKELTDALDIPMPTIEAIETWEDLEEFISALDGAKAQVWCTLEKRKDTGEEVSKLAFSEPKGFTMVGLDSASAPKASPAKKLGPNGKPLKKKVS